MQNLQISLKQKEDSDYGLKSIGFYRLRTISKTPLIHSLILFTSRAGKMDYASWTGPSWTQKCWPK